MGEKAVLAAEFLAIPLSAVKIASERRCAIFYVVEGCAVFSTQKKKLTGNLIGHLTGHLTGSLTGTFYRSRASGQ